jgi:hypothetical protein
LRYHILYSRQDKRGVGSILSEMHYESSQTVSYIKLVLYYQTSGRIMNVYQVKQKVQQQELGHKFFWRTLFHLVCWKSSDRIRTFKKLWDDYILQ